MKAIVYCGFSRETEIPIEITKEEASLGIALIDCLECEGTGIFIGHPEIDEPPCVVCKGTGKVFINV